MRFFLNLLYSVLFYPVLVGLFHIWAVYSKPVRKAIRGRYRYQRVLKSGMKEIKNPQNIILIHTASMGEFEHIKPLITEMSIKHQAEFVVTFFSPSGYENVREFPGVRLFMYLPFDFKFIWKRVYKILAPRKVVISKHDVWPNQVWAAEALNIPTYLINASLPAKSSRINPLTSFFQKYIYRSLSYIFTIGEEDTIRFRNNFPKCRIREVGDTKFDQVLQRKKASEQKTILPDKWLRGKRVLLFGSIWPEDTQVLFPALKKIIAKQTDLRIILVPHQLEPKYIQEILETFAEEEVILYSERAKLADEKVLIVDQIGILADLYKYATLAYVGGSFRQGIHNVMEPAIYGIPVLYGPIHKNAFEAEELLNAGGSELIDNPENTEQVINHLLSDDEYRNERGRKAILFAEARTGGTEKLMEFWQ